MARSSSPTVPLLKPRNSWVAINLVDAKDLDDPGRDLGIARPSNERNHTDLESDCWLVRRADTPATVIDGGTQPRRSSRDVTGPAEGLLLLDDLQARDELSGSICFPAPAEISPAAKRLAGGRQRLPTSIVASHKRLPEAG